MAPRKVTVVDYGIGNIRSVLNACGRAGAEASVVQNGSELEAQKPERIILPGVGAVGAALANLRERGLELALNDAVQTRKIPFLGICVGMQVMSECCLEFGEHMGLGWLPGTVERLAPESSDIRLPHVGWNTVRVTAKDDRVLDGLDGEDFYFVHAYAMQCPEEFVAARTDYSVSFVSAVRKGHIRGVQFHPEKSAMLGARLIGAFLD